MEKATQQNSFSEEAQWVWKSNPDPWSETHTPEWSYYSDVENSIIEAAYQDKQVRVVLDKYCIDFKKNIQISKNDTTRQRPVKREVKIVQRVTETAVFDLPQPKLETTLKPGGFGTFIWESYLLGKWRDIDRATLVTMAADGILQEGQLIGETDADSPQFVGILYRGGTMNAEQINTYEEKATTGELCGFSTFTSTSRKRSIAERFGNALQIIEIVQNGQTSVNASPFSQYPEEEEQLIMPGFMFKVVKVEFNSSTNKHFIYLKQCNDL